MSFANRVVLVCATVAAVAAALPACTTVTYDHDEHWPIDPSGFPTIGAQGVLIVTNSYSDTASWIDVANPGTAPIFEEPVGRLAAEREGPHHGAALPNGPYVFFGLSNFVPGSGSGPHGTHGTGTVPGWALKYDMRTHELVDEVEVDRNPGDVRLTPDGTRLLQSHFDLVKITEAEAAGKPVEDMYSNLAIIDTDDMRTPERVPVCPAPHGLAISDDASKVYLACYASDELAIVDLASTATGRDRPVTRVPLGLMPSYPTMPLIQPYAVALSPADGSVWVTCPTQNMDQWGSLYVYDPGPGAPGTGAWRAPIQTVGKPFFPTFSADGSKLYVPEQPYTLTVRDGQSGAVLQQVTMAPADCTAPHAVWVTPDQTRAFVICEGDHLTNGTVAVVNLTVADPFVETVVPVGVFPDDVIFLGPP